MNEQLTLDQFLTVPAVKQEKKSEPQTCKTCVHFCKVWGSKTEGACFIDVICRSNDPRKTCNEWEGG